MTRLILLNRDLRFFLDQVKEKTPQDFIEINDEIDPKYEMTAIIDRYEQLRKLPVLQFNNIRGSNYKTIVNVAAQRARIAMGINTTKDKMLETYTHAIDHIIQPKIVANGPVQEVVLKDDEVDMMKFPQLVFHQDEKPYITAGIHIAKDPETGVSNASFNRLQINGKNRLGIRMAPGKHLSEFYARAEENGKPLDVAVVLGYPPAWAVGALFIGAYGIDEIPIMGALAGEPIEMVKCKTIDVEVPAYAEIILETQMLPYVREEEGPFGEFSGYSVAKGMKEVLEVKAITQRKDPLYQTICGGKHMEHLYLATLPMESNLYKSVKGTIGSTIDVHVPCMGTVFIKMKKRQQGQAKNAIFAAFAADQYIKHAIVVDEDVDIHSEAQIFSAISSRVQADRDIFVVSDVCGVDTDPSAPNPPLTAKMGIDATAKPFLNEFPPKTKIPEEAVAMAERFVKL